MRPFAHVHANLAAPVEADIAAHIPPFQAAEIFIVAEGAGSVSGANTGDTAAEGDDQPTMDTAASNSIYGAEVDGEVEIKTVRFPDVRCRL